MEVAEESFRVAHVLARRYAEPSIELGYFVYAVKSDSAEALQHFEAGQRIAEADFQNALIGQIKCYNDLGQVGKAKEILRRLKELFPEDEQGKIFQVELEEPAVGEP